MVHPQRPLFKSLVIGSEQLPYTGNIYGLRAARDFLAGNGKTQGESTIGLEPVSLRMLRGAFCLLGIGHLLAAIALAVEIQIHRRNKKKRQKAPAEDKKTHKLLILGKSVILLKRGYRRAMANVYTGIDKALGPAI